MYGETLEGSYGHAVTGGCGLSRAEWSTVRGATVGGCGLTRAEWSAEAAVGGCALIRSEVLGEGVPAGG